MRSVLCCVCVIVRRQSEPRRIVAQRIYALHGVTSVYGFYVGSGVFQTSIRDVRFLALDTVPEFGDALHRSACEDCNS